MAHYKRVIVKTKTKKWNCVIRARKIIFLDLIVSKMSTEKKKGYVESLLLVDSILMCRRIVIEMSSRYFNSKCSKQC